MASDAGAAGATSTAVVARTPPAAAVRVAFPGPRASSRPPRATRAVPGAELVQRTVIGPHVALGRAHPRGERHPLAGHQAGRVGADLDPLGRARQRLRTTCCRMGLDPGTSAVTRTSTSPTPPARTMPVESTWAAARPAWLEEDGGVGDRSARGVEGASGELQRVADGELEARGGDLQPRGRRWCYRVAGRRGATGSRGTSAGRWSSREYGHGVRSVGSGRQS